MAQSFSKLPGKFSIAVAVCGTTFTAYCLFRLLKRKFRGRNHSYSHVPNINDKAAANDFATQEINLAIESIAKGDLEECVEHLSWATAICQEPSKLLDMYEQHPFPAEAFHLMLHRMPFIREKLSVIRRQRGEEKN